MFRPRLTLAMRALIWCLWQLVKRHWWASLEVHFDRQSGEFRVFINTADANGRIDRSLFLGPYR